MKRLVAAAVATTLLLSVAAPVAAAPVRNPQVGQWEIVCPEPVGTFVVIAKGVPGWTIDPTDSPPPILLRQAEFWVWAEGVAIDGPYVLTAPPGLESRLYGPCLLHMYGGSMETFDIRSEASWFQFL